MRAPEFFGQRLMLIFSGELWINTAHFLPTNLFPNPSYLDFNFILNLI